MTFLLKRENGNLYYFDSGDFKAHFIDLSNPKAVSWLKEKMKQEIKSEGFKGWMADFGGSSFRWSFSFWN